MRIRAYIRVSSRKQVRGASLDDQRRANASRAAQLGTIIEQTYTEAGESAFKEKLDKRVAFQQMLTDAKAGRFDTLIVYDLSRFSRYARVALQIAADLERQGVTVISATEYFDMTTAAGRMTFTMLAAAAQFKSDHLSERMRAIRKSEAERGEHIGPVPLGYTRQVDGHLAIDATTAPAVLLFGQLYASGTMGISRIVEQVREQTGIAINALAADDMVDGAVYAGHACYKGQIVVRHAHPAIWDAALWERICEVRQQRRSRRTRPVQQHYALLAGKAVCASCGAPMWHHPGSIGGRYYRCASDDQRRPAGHPDLLCAARAVHAEEVEAAALDWLKAAILTPDLLTVGRQLLHEERPTPAAPDREQLEHKLKRLARAYADGAYSDAEYTQRRTVLLHQLVDTVPTAPPTYDIEAALSAMQDIPRLLDAATAQERQAILGQLVTQVYLKKQAGVMAIRPTRIAVPLFVAAARSGRWNLTNGVGFGPGGDLTCIPAHWLTRPIILQAA